MGEPDGLGLAPATQEDNTPARASCANRAPMCSMRVQMIRAGSCQPAELRLDQRCSDGTVRECHGIAPGSPSIGIEDVRSS